MDRPASPLPVAIRWQPIVVLFAAGSAIALAGWAATQAMLRLGGYGTQLGLLALFDLNGEGNVPSFIATTLLFTSAAFAAVTALAERSRPDGLPAHWAVLAAGLAYLSLDESVQLHEQVSHMLARWRGAGTSYTVLQVSLTGTLALLVAIAFAPFLRRLPSRTRNGLLAAGAVYVGGAAGVDACGALWLAHGAASERTSDLAYVLFTTAEEYLELAGQLLFLVTVGRYVERRHGRLALVPTRPD